jgi:hypothetical protein
MENYSFFQEWFKGIIDTISKNLSILSLVVFFISLVIFLTILYKSKGKFNQPWKIVILRNDGPYEGGEGFKISEKIISTHNSFDKGLEYLNKKADKPIYMFHENCAELDNPTFAMVFPRGYFAFKKSLNASELS